MDNRTRSTGRTPGWWGRGPLLSLIFLACLGLVQITVGTVIPENDGLGFDGVRYARVAREPMALLNGDLDLYSAQRVIPSLVVRVIIEVVRIPPDSEIIRTVFALLNLALLLAACVMWWRLCADLSIESAARWLGFSLLFLNLGNLRLPFFYSPLTDTTAFALGASLVFFHLRRSDSGMLLILALGALTWRSFFFLGLPLYLFPRVEKPSTDSRPSTPWSILAGVLLMSSLLSGLANLGTSNERFLSAGTVIAVFGAIMRDLVLGGGLRSPTNWRVPFRRFGPLAFVGAGVIILIMAMARHGISRVSLGEVHPYPIWLFVTRDVLGRGILSPAGEFLTNHLRFYSMTPLLVLLLWPALCRTLHTLGPGMTLYVAGHLLMTPNPESRQLIDGHFGLVVALGLAASAARIPLTWCWIVAFFGLVTSTVWLPSAWGGSLLGLGNPTVRSALSWVPLVEGGPAGRQALVGITGLAVLAACWLVSRNSTRRSDLA